MCRNSSLKRSFSNAYFCRYHARNYGFLAANPFGRKALTGGKLSRVVVPAGKSLRLRFAVYVYSTPKGDAIPVSAVCRLYSQGK